MVVCALVLSSMLRAGLADEPRRESGLQGITAAALWQAAAHSRDREAIARLLQQAIRGEDKTCAWVSDYQTVEHSETRLLFKVKCPGVPLYGVRVEQGDGLRLEVVGGDGLIGAFNTADGEIVSFDHPPASGLLAAGERKSDGKEPDRPGPLILVSAAVNLLIVLGVLVVIAVVLRRAKPLPPLDSEIKNRLVLESREVLPNIYRHPDGYYIVRGRHGRRRIFPWLPSALLYRDLGIRVLEHRAFHFSGASPARENGR